MFDNEDSLMKVMAGSQFVLSAFKILMMQAASLKKLPNNEFRRYYTHYTALSLMTAASAGAVLWLFHSNGRRWSPAQKSSVLKTFIPTMAFWMITQAYFSLSAHINEPVASVEVLVAYGAIASGCISQTYEAVKAYMSPGLRQA